MTLHAGDRIVRGACPHDCPDTCAFLYDVKNGKLVDVTGDPDHPMTRGGLCVKLNGFAEHHYNPERLLYPMRRTGSKGSGLFERISWSDALAEIKSRWTDIIAAYGAQAIMPHVYLGHQGTLNGLTAGDAFFNHLGIDRSGKNLLRVRLLDGLDHDRRPVRRAGPGEPRLREVHHRVGDEHDQHQPARLALHPGGAEKRCEDRGHRSRAHAHRQAGRLARRHQARHGRRARAGHDERHHWRGTCRLRLRGEIYARLRGVEGARRRLSAGTRCSNHRYPRPTFRS